MSNWVVSLNALEKLAEELASQPEVTCELLGRALGLAEVHRGDGKNGFTQLLMAVADTGEGFTHDHLDEIERRYFRGSNIKFFKDLAVQMDLAEPANPLLTSDELQELYSLAERAQLFNEKGWRILSGNVRLPLKNNAATSKDPRDQWRLWLRACARQDPPEPGKAWLVNLAKCAADACDDANIKRTFGEVSDRCKSAAGSWNLIELLREPPARPSADPSRRGVTAAPDQPAPIELPKGPPQAGYALVIGISKYSAQGPASLKCAANDAQQLATYLQGQPDIDFSGERVRTLTDEDATLRGVLGGLDWLRVECASSAVRDPLAIVYFSGHGMPDPAGRHFLVPHDGDPQQLFATALWNRTFSAALEQIPTRRLVVLLDACHAGSMVELPGAKAGAAPSYDPGDEREGLRLEPGHGRYFIASCAAGQQSFEGGDNGIFTQSLLGLLRFEGLEAEKLDLADVYRLLRERVDRAARRLFGGRSQTPTGNIPEATASTGLILAVNRQRVSANRLKEFQQSVCKHLEANSFPQKVTIKRRLTDFVERRELPTEVDPEFFELFMEGFQRWERGNPRAVPETCGDLANLMMGGPRAAPGAQEVRETSDFTSAAAPDPSAQFETAASTPTLPTSSATVVPAPAAAPGSQRGAIPAYQWRIKTTDG